MIGLRIPRAARKRAVTLIEVLITVMIITFSGTAILAALVYGRDVTASLQNRNAAMREAIGVMESVRATPFFDLRPFVLTDVVLDNRGTTQPADDLRGTVVLKLYDSAGNEIVDWTQARQYTTGETTVPTTQGGIAAEVAVYWRHAGVRSSKLQTFTLASYIAP